LSLSTWLIAPEVVAESVDFKARKVLAYPGIKEDVYAPRFTPDLRIRALVGVSGEEILVTARPPASEAHYHNPQSDALFEASINVLSVIPNVKIVLLPRNTKQALSLRESWPQLFTTGRVIIPKQAIDGLNLIWHSDLVISGGGTMNREAAALGVPVFSVFRGKLGAVDRYLASQGRLVLLENAEDVRTKLVAKRRARSLDRQMAGDAALKTILRHITAAIETKRKLRRDDVLEADVTR